MIGPHSVGLELPSVRSAMRMRLHSRSNITMLPDTATLHEAERCAHDPHHTIFDLDVAGLLNNQFMHSTPHHLGVGRYADQVRARPLEVVGQPCVLRAKHVHGAWLMRGVQRQIKRIKP